MKRPEKEPEDFCQVPPPATGRDPMMSGVGAALHRTDCMIRRRMNEVSRSLGVEAVTMTHGWILKYLFESQGREVFQRDIERDFSIARSTTTLVLQLMEKKGYITRTPVERDNRLKQLKLTEAGLQAHSEICHVFAETNRQVNELLTKDERRQLLTLLAKLQAGITGPGEGPETEEKAET